MALDFVKGQAVSIGNRVFKKVAGNLPGLLGITKGRGGDTSDFAGITATKYKNISEIQNVTLIYKVSSRKKLAFFSLTKV